MKKKVNHFSECLDRIAQGEDLESCLKEYPEESEELRLMFQTVVGVRRLSATIEPRPEFISRIQTKLAREYHVTYLSWRAQVAGILKPVRRFAVMTALVIVILAVVFSSGFSLSALASENAMPGEIMYPVKLATEQVRLAFAFSDEGKAECLTHFSENRAEEMAYAIENNDDATVESALEKLEENLAEVEKIIGPGEVSSAKAASDHVPPGLLKIENMVKDSSARVKDKLKEIKEPDMEKKDKINDRVTKAYDKAIEAIEKAKADKAK